MTTHARTEGGNRSRTPLRPPKAPLSCDHNVYDPCGWRDANDRKLGVPIGYGHLLLVPFSGARGGRTQKFAGAPEKVAFTLPTGIYMYGSAQPLPTPLLSSREHMQRVVPSLDQPSPWNFSANGLYRLGKPHSYSNGEMTRDEGGSTYFS